MEYLIATGIALAVVALILLPFEWSAEQRMQRKYLKEVKRNVRA